MRLLRILAFVSLCSNAQSQPPGPAPRKTTEDNQRKANGKQGEASRNEDASDKISTAIKQLTSEVTSWKQQSDSAIQKDDAPADWWSKWSAILSAVASLAIAVLAFFQWRAMRGHKDALDAMATHMRDGLIETTKAANAASRSADVAEESVRLTQRADVLIGEVGINTPDISRATSVLITLENFGPTRANELKITAFLTTPEHSEPAPAIHGPLTLGAHDTVTLRFAPFGEWCSSETFERIRTGQIPLTFKSKVSFRDVFDQIKTEIAEGRFDSNRRIFVRTTQRSDGQQSEEPH